VEERRNGYIDIETKIDEIMKHQVESAISHAKCSAATEANLISMREDMREIKNDVKTLGDKVINNKARLNGVDDKIYIAMSKRLEKKTMKTSRNVSSFWAAVVSGVIVAVIKVWEYFK